MKGGNYMQTPKKYIKNLKEGVIVDDMLEDCLFSVNKRAKNCRNHIAKYSRQYMYSNEDYINYYIEKKDEYYRQKEVLLSLLEPKCIHKECIPIERKKIYDYESEYVNVKYSDIIRRGYYFDEFEGYYVNFIWAKTDEVRYQYYLFYEMKNHSFHKCIDEDSLDQYSLDIVEIDRIITYGHDTDDLLSPQFVKKVVDLIESNQYKYIKSDIQKK